MNNAAILLIAQAATVPATTPAEPPDIELNADVRVREVVVTRQSPIEANLRAEPGLSKVTVERSEPAGATRYRNLTINARVAAWLAQDPADTGSNQTDSSTGETPP